MCQFFSFCTEPEENGGKRFYNDWKYRKNHIQEENDSHSLICGRFGLDEDKCNKYEYNPLTKEFNVDRINSSVDDSIQAEDWANRLDFRRVIEPLIVKPIINPLDLPPVAEVTPEIVELLKAWASVWDSVGDFVWVYTASFFDLKYEYDCTPANRLFEMGIIPMFYGKTWKLHTGKDAHIIYEWTPEEK